MKKRIVNQFTFDPNVESAKEHCTGESKTIPDQNSKLKDIVAKYVRTGIMPEKTEVYDAESPMPDFEKMDIQDKISIAKEMAEKIGKKRKELNQKATELRQIQRDAELVKKATEKATLEAQKVIKDD